MGADPGQRVVELAVLRDVLILDAASRQSLTTARRLGRARLRVARASVTDVTQTPHAAPPRHVPA
jgi:hypothetical protein